MSWDQFGGDPKTTTLAEAKEWLRGRVGDGAKCPCCTQLAKVYRRKLNSGMAYALILIARYFREHPEEGWVHITKLLLHRQIDARAMDYSKLQYWGLIEEKPASRDDGNPHAGYYRITDLGREFVRLRASVPRHIYIFDNRVLPRPSRETVTIREALGDKFNYDELMRGAP